MKNEKNLTDELEKDLDAELDAEDGAENEDGEIDDSFDEFDVDDDGDIEIPDDVEPRSDDGEDSDEDGGAGDNEQPEDGGAPDDDTDGEEQPAPSAPDTSDNSELENLKRELESYKAQTADTLKKMGVDSNDPLGGLVKLAAEAEGKSVDEYLAGRNERERQAKEYEQIFERDIAELHAAYPETAQYKHIRELPDTIRKEFSKYRQLGLSAEKAYAAANPKGIRNEAVASARRQPPPSKSHLKSVVPKGSKDNSVPLSKRELEQYRDIFPDATDEEIKQLYKNATRK